MIRPHARWRNTSALIAVLLLGTSLALGSTVVDAPPAAASTTIDFDGRGYGHGRGMSQYGAYGYAKNYGWNSAQILDHYYGTGTKSLTFVDAADAPSPQRLIRLERMSNKATKVAIVDGALTLRAGSGTVIGLPSGTKAIEIARHGTSSSAPLKYRTGSTCGGSFSAWVVTSRTILDVGKADQLDPDNRDRLIHVCPVNGAGYDPASGATVWYPGSIRAHSVDGKQETVNITTIEKQLRGIIPSEMPPSWGDTGGTEALRAQAVAARSYALTADGRYAPYANTCDTIYCQVYLGWYSSRKVTSTNPTGRVTTTNTDQARLATDRVVRVFKSNNRIARTEFHSTSGGWTAGGTFPSVKDLGDSISPVHTWTASRSSAPLENAYGAGSPLTGFTVTARSGYPDIPGRVVTVRLQFANGSTRDVSGEQIRSMLGLRSNWFFADISDSAARYITAVYRLFLKRNPTSNEISYWRSTVERGYLSELTSALSVSDEWAGVEIDNLYRKILGRPADASGRAYWLERVRAGLKIEDIAIYFYGGPEYFSRQGSTNSSYVTGLYRDILGRSPDSGHAYWVDQLNRGVLTRSDVAAGFYASIESRRQRVTRLYQVILGRSPDAAGRDYWADQLPRIGDVSLAAYLAASREYYLRVT